MNKSKAETEIGILWILGSVLRICGLASGGFYLVIGGGGVDVIIFSVSIAVGFAALGSISRAMAGIWASLLTD